MFDIQWKGKIGYGDIVSPICYAHNISYKLNTPVSLTFRWDHGSGRKIHPSDPEPLWLRASYLFSKAVKHKTDVTLIHKFRTPLDCNHTGYDWTSVAQDKFHNYWHTTLTRRPKKDVVVINSTEGNLVSLSDYGKSWKDPVGSNWNQVVSKIKENYRVYVVDYRTPIDTLCSLLLHSYCFIGYHGTAAWIAKMLMVPSIIYTEGGKLSTNAFHSAVILPKFTNAGFLLDNLTTFVASAQLNITRDHEDYKKYRPDYKMMRSLVGHG